jgi:prepilin-type N-terminal cleavage/methylation domain-containing protein
MSRRSNSAFTLIELLTVIAITAILLTIIIVPVIQSFNLTRMAQAFADAQDRARVLSNNIAREISNSVGVRDLSAYVTTTINDATVQVPASTLAIDVPSVGLDGSEIANSKPVQVLLPYAKVDIMEPSQTNPQDVYSNGPNSFHNPSNGYIDPTIQKHTGQVTLPVGIGATLVRYFIGLHDPYITPSATDPITKANPYNDPYSGLLMAITATRDNLYVLYRSEVQPYVYRPYQGPVVVPIPPAAFRPNLLYFQADPTDSTIVDEDDPNFFTFIPGVDLETDGVTLTASGQAKATRIANWKKVSTLQSDISRYDLIFPVYDKHTRKIVNSGGVPEVISLAQFRPTRISSESVPGETAARLGEESASSGSVSPDVFVTQFGLWSNPAVRTYPIGWQPGATLGAVNSYYEVGRKDLTDGNTIFAYPMLPGTTGIVGVDDLTGGTPLFSLDTYDSVVSSGGLYPFSQAVALQNLNSSVVARQMFVPYSWNRQTGKVIASFGINEVGNISIPPSALNPNNLPTVATEGVSGIVYTPSTDPGLTTGVFSDPAFASVNEQFNKIWNDYPQLRPNIQRFIDLRVTPNADGTRSPLYPDFVNGQVSGLGHVVDANGNTLYSRVGIVPGTDEVVGPDQLPGVGYGTAVRYTRVTQNPGPDQYCINYTDLPQPTDATGLNVDYGVAFPDFLNPQPTYTPTDFTTAILQPRYKAGYLQLCSDPNDPLPNGNIQVSYRFQVSGKLTGILASSLSATNQATSDSFSIDYDSRQLMDVLLTVRNYPQTTLNPNPQSVTLKSTASVRNYQR